MKHFGKGNITIPIHKHVQKTCRPRPYQLNIDVRWGPSVPRFLTTHPKPVYGSNAIGVPDPDFLDQSREPGGCTQGHP